MTGKPVSAESALLAILKAAYVTGSSLNEIAADFAISSTRVHRLLKEYHPEVLRDNKDPEVRRRANRKTTRPRPGPRAKPEIGKCLSCRMEILGPVHGGRKTCASCMAVKTYGSDYYQTACRAR